MALLLDPPGEPLPALPRAAPCATPDAMARGAAREGFLRSSQPTRGSRHAGLPGRSIGMRQPTRGYQTHSRASNQARQGRLRRVGRPQKRRGWAWSAGWIRPLLPLDSSRCISARAYL